MGLFDDDGVAPEHGMPDLKIAPSDHTADDFEDDADPIEHNDIRNTPVSLPEAKKSRTPKLQKDIEGLYTMVGTGIFPFDQQVGVTIIDSAENCSAALYELSTKNPRLRRTLESFLSAGAYGAVITAHLPIAVIVATKYIPPLRDQYGEMLKNFKEKNAA